MLRNYLIVALRNLRKHLAHSFINIAGLSAGMAVALLIGLWIWDEVSYNRNFSNYDKIVMVMQNSTHGNQISTMNGVPFPLSTELRTAYGADFKRVTTATSLSKHIVAYDGDKQLFKDGIFVQPEFLPMFSVRMQRGSFAALNEPHSAVLSRSLATAMYGDQDPIGKIIKIDRSSVMRISGIFDDFPYNSEFKDASLLMSWASYVSDNDWMKGSLTNWDRNRFQIYAQLEDNADLKSVSAKVKGALEGHGRKDKPQVLLHPMSRWRLYGDFYDGVNTGGAIDFVRMIAVIGVFVLVLACINFMNLSTARSEKRAKEVGIRKAIGSRYRQLVGQFLGESLLTTAISFCAALLLAQLSLPFFNDLTDKQMGFFWTSVPFWLMAIGFIAFTGLLSGSYPAFYLSSISSVSVLKGTFKAGRFASLPRKVLVVLQFTVSVSLIIDTLVVFQQIKYAKDRPIGYTRDGLITVSMNSSDLYPHYNSLRTDLLASGAVANVAMSSSPTTDVWDNQSGFSWEGMNPDLNPTFSVVALTHDFGKTAGWQFLEGRDFSRDYATDSSGIVLNETAVKYMGLKEPVVGRTIRYLYGSHKDQRMHVLGVIRDMVMKSPFDPVKQTIFMMDTSDVGMSVITVRINPNMSTGKALAAVAALFKKYNPGSPFNYTFNSEDYARKFDFEQRIGSLATFFAAFAIFISCLGLLGLASFMAGQRTKEIGIRKLLGASVSHLWGLLSKEFLSLVSLSFLVAIPLSWWLMNNWLRQYDYRTTISIWIFVLTAASALLITLATVSFHSIKASMADPVRSLRSE